MRELKPIAVGRAIDLSRSAVSGPIATRDVLCTICERPSTSSFLVHGYRFFVCETCNYALLDPQAAQALRTDVIFDDDYFSGGGAGYLDYHRDAEALRLHGRRYGALLARVGVRHVLDVGAAAGYILRGLIEAGCSGIGIEPNASMAAFAAREQALDVRNTTLEDFDAAERFDAVVMLQVVVHLQDIRNSFERVSELTRPGGWCLIEFGNRASLTASVLQSSWHEYAPPSVRRVFSLHALRLLLAEYGFTLRRCGHPPKYLRAAHALSLLRYKASNALARAVIERLSAIIPPAAQLRYVGDDITWALFEKTEFPR